MKLKYLSAICFFVPAILWPISSTAEPFLMPKFPKHEIKITNIHYEGKKIDPKTASLSQRLLYLEAPKRLEADLHRVGKGADRRLEFVMVERQNNANTAINTFTFKTTEYMILEKYEKVVNNSSGKRLRKEFYYMSHPANKYPDDLVHPYTIEVTFRGLELDKPGAKRRFNIWLPPTVVIPMELKVCEKETIKLPIGSRECYRVEIRPFMTAFLGPFLGRLIQRFVPSYVFWFDINGTHPLLKYKGPLGKVNVIGVPDEVYDTVKLEPDPSR